MNHAPVPALSAVRVPWWASTMARAMVSPRPLPGLSVAFAKRRKICPDSAGVRPMPVSVTVMTAESPDGLGRPANGDGAAGRGAAERVVEQAAEDFLDSFGVVQPTRGAVGE